MSAKRGSTGLSVQATRKVLKGDTTEFNNVARIVFSAAKRAGVTVGHQKGNVSGGVAQDDYVKQLLRFQQHSKRKGGSLGKLSLNVATALSKKHVVTQAPTNIKTTASVVPSLNLPLKTGEGAVGQKQKVALKAVSEEQSTSTPLAAAVPKLVLPGVTKAPLATPMSATIAAAASATKVKSVPSLKVPLSMKTPDSTEAAAKPLAGKPPSTATLTTATTTATTTSTLSSPVIDIEEDVASRMDAGTSQLNSSDWAQRTTDGVPKAASTSASPAAKPVTDTPTPTTATEAFVPKPRVKVSRPKTTLKAAEVETPKSVEAAVEEQEPEVASTADWMLQRERELAEIKERQEAELEAAKTAKEAEERRIESDRWIEERAAQMNTPETVEQYMARLRVNFPHFEEVEKIRQLDPNAWQEALALVQPSLKSTASKLSLSTQLIGWAAHITAKRAGGPEAVEILEKMEDACRKKKVDPAFLKESLVIAHFKAGNHDRVAAAAQLPITGVRRSTLKSMLHSTAKVGKWESALALLDSMKTKVSDPFCYLEMAFLKAIAQKDAGERADRARLVQLIEKRLREKMGELGKMHALALAQSYTRLRRGHSALRLVTEFKDKGELDERLCASLFWHVLDGMTVVEDADRLMLAEGLDLNNTEYVTAKIAAYALTKPEESWKHFQRMTRSNTFTWSRPLLTSLCTVFSQLVRPEVAEMVLEGISSLDLEGRLGERRRADVYPSLAQLQMYDEIVDLHANFPVLAGSKGMRLEAEVALNTALKALGKEPISDATEATLQAAKAAAAGADAPTVTLVLPPTEQMLELAKERSWQEALNLLGKIAIPPGVNLAAEQTTTLTLIHNCGLSAAVDRIEAVQAVANHMANRGIPTNSTTHNTIMSSYARSEAMWPKALEQFQSMSPALKDTSTFSVLLALLARRSLWEESMQLLADFKSTLKTTPSAMVYNLIVQGVHRGHWTAAAQVFKEMHAAHGPENIKDLAVTRIVRCLEGAERHKEVSVLREMMKATKKKKKKGKQ